MESDRRKIEETYLKAVDIGYSYRLAKKMEEFKSNPVLGYRTAGSKAEFDTGEFLKAEMERIGLSDIHKDELCLDSWEFEKAVMRFTDRDGEKHEIQLGAYQTEFVTDGWKEYPLVYAGRGKEADYDGVDVTGCLVMVDINQRDEWWINYPVYQAYLKGAAAVIDKDFASELLAEQLDADALIILTAVEKVAINFGKPNQTWLDRLTPAEARRYEDEGQFAPGSMLPKVQAAVKFAESKPGRTALITLLEKAKDGIAGKTGTSVAM